MKYYVNILLGVIKLALAVGLLGGLADMTLNMRAEAVKAHQTGLVSLKKLNQSLIEDP